MGNEMQAVIAGVEDRSRESFDDPSRGDVTWFTLIDGDRTPTRDLCGGVAEFAPGSVGLKPHRHEQSEIYFITEGTGILTIDGVERAVRPGQAVFIPGNAEHGIRNGGASILRLFYVFPTARFSDVVYRFSPAEVGTGRG
jgi:mannose-6-phosphate isomerase-like protein (cupin superfamily)